MIAVLDTSAAVEILLHRPRSERLAGVIANADWVLVPDLYTAELTNVFWKYHRFNGLPRDTCERLTAHGLALPDTYVDARELQREAFAMACVCGRPVYDMLFLVLARRHAAVLLTMDVQLRTIATEHDVVAE